MNKKSFLPISFFIIILFLIIFSVYKGNQYQKEMEDYPGFTICKLTFCKEVRRGKTAYIKYFLNDTLYRRKGGSCPENSDLRLNKYFLLKYSTLDNDKIQVDFSQEITNVEQINELESKLKNWFDLPYVSE
ncbi:hypothetical protein [Flavobacterium sp.]|uniref:hypothetical protein n=1 Tax=Flavobacterium sp. TaxID=239 RepID=UPI000EE218D3|nr:hypothetical protein [Flavobacterium sp.]HCQ13420.1 hypothetical protein [Flavobacterium sp.]